MANKFAGFITRKTIDEINMKFDTICDLTPETKEIVETLNSKLDDALAVAEAQNAEVHNMSDNADTIKDAE